MINHQYIGQTNLTLTNAQGKIINKFWLDSSELELKLPAGLYFIKLENKQGSGVRKLVVY